MAKKLVLIDGHSLIHRGYHALPPLSTSHGQPTNAVYGFVQMILPLLEAEKPDQVLVAFDPPGPTFRSEMDASYKANRAEMEPELASQMELTRELVEALGLARLEVAGYEADDVIGTVARQAAERGDEVLIVSGDRDLVQLVGPRVRVLATLRGVKETKTYDEASVREEYGVGPEQLADVKALAGDPSDNIPGVPGIGPVGAANLIREFGDLETVLAHLDGIKRESLRERLREHQELARLSKELARIRCDVPLPDPDPDLSWRQPQVREARRLFARLEFGNLLERTAAWGSAWDGELEVATEAELAALCARARDNGHLGLAPAATEDGEQQALALSAGPGRVLFWELKGGDGGDMGGLFAASSAPGLPECLKQALADGALPKWGLKLKDVSRMLRPCGVRLAGYELDAEVADYLLNPSRSDHSVMLLAARELGWWVGSDAEQKSGRPAWQVRPAVELLALEEVEQALRAELRQADLDRIFREVEMPLVGVLADMEERGITVDVAKLEALGQQVSASLAEIASRVYELAGQEFNLDSPKQIGEVLFGVLKLPKGKRTKTGWSTNADVLEELAVEHEIAARILEHRELAKLRSTYVEGLLRAADPETHRIHTTLEQTVTATGRLSSRNPNLQNIPIRTELGREIRSCFVAAPGMMLVKADYSQIEFRLLAHFCRDENLLQAFHSGEDVHRRTAALIFDVAPGDVTPDMRRVAKTVNFAVLYGMGSTALAQQLGIKRTEAQRFIEDYFARLSSVREYLDSVVAAAKADGYVTTLLGRRRPLPELHSPDRQVQAYAERAAANTPLQGSAADIVKVAMVRVSNLLQQHYPEAALLLQVHDELVLEAPRDQAVAVGKLVGSTMESVTELAVPLVADVAWGENWRDMQPI
ncbi:MAG: DNA polymerase I [Armatimonadetes bacterium]|nr:DNA polymerase I [Armatimonadota bacterium]